jgi:DNA-binding NtrC family response regulator
VAAFDLVVPFRSSSLTVRRDLAPGPELADAVRMAMRAAALGVVDPSDLACELDGASALQHATTLTFQEATRRFQRALLMSQLDATGWNVALTARRLDLARSHVYNLMDSMQISRPVRARGPHTPAITRA